MANIFEYIGHKYLFGKHLNFHTICNTNIYSNIHSLKYVFVSKFLRMSQPVLHNILLEFSCWFVCPRGFNPSLHRVHKIKICTEYLLLVQSAISDNDYNCEDDDCLLWIVLLFGGHWVGRQQKTEDGHRSILIGIQACLSATDAMQPWNYIHWCQQTKT